MSILANVVLSFCSLTASSNKGPSCLHGSHQGAQKSTIIGFSLEASMTSLIKLSVVTSLILLLTLISMT